jgi:hypothetical protein
MKRLPSRSAVWLGYVVVILFTAEILKLLIVHAKWLGSEKDAIGAVTTIINSILLVLGTLFAYFRFFHGRTFARRLDVELDVKIIRASSPAFLHAIDLTIKNIGTVPIWNPAVILRIQQHGENVGKPEEIDQWQDPFPIDRGSVIDTQESSQFYAWRQIPQEVWAVTYWVKVWTSRGEAWTKAVTVANTPDHLDTKSLAKD